MIALSRLCRASGVLLAFSVLAGAALVATGVPDARAQSFDWLGGLLGGGTPQRSYNRPSPGYDTGGGGYDTDSGRGRRRERRKAQRHREQPSQPAQQTQQAAKPKAPVKNATLFVGVFGDSLGVFLANGLDEALADRTEVAVLRKAKGSTGMVTQSFYDWPKTIEDYLAKQSKAQKEEKDAQGDKEKSAKSDTAKSDTAKTPAPDKAKPQDQPEKIDVGVIMIGSNDRQPISQDGKSYPPGSEEWTTIYRKRVTAIAESFRKRKIPLVWVGIPITKDEVFADDMAALNEIYRDVASKTGATYVDTWEAFSDDNGNFAANGPDISGQNTRLRSSDGIHFTAAGARKLAHFVETPVRRDLDGKTPLPQLPTAEAPATDGTKGGKENGAKDIGAKDNGGKGKPPGDKDREAKPAVAVVKPEAGPIKSLSDAPSAKGGELAQAPRSAAPEPGDKGPAETTPQNRADNFRWPAGGLPQP